jgi:hypothetical protein
MVKSVLRLMANAGWRLGCVSAAAVWLILLTVAPVAAAGGFGVEAAVDRNVVSVGGTLRLTITVTGGSDVERPELGDLEGFQILGTSSSQNLSMVNMKVTRSMSLIYTLGALREGEFTLGPFTVKAGDNLGETEALTVRVIPASSGRPPAGGQEQVQDEGSAYATAEVDKRRAYVGEQVTYTLKFAYRLRMLEGMEFVPPEHTGFWYEDLGDAGPVIEVIDGRQYYVVTKKLAFFPISSGAHTIGRAGIKYVAEGSEAFSRDPFSLFGRDPFGRLRGREGVAMADSIDIQVMPLPAVGRPADFSGAVGSFDVTARSTREEVKVGESITLVVNITGKGNLKSISDLPAPDIPGFRVFAPKSKQTISTDQGMVGGDKRFEFVLVAEEPGTFTIDSIGFTYFNTVSGEYTTARAAPIGVRVIPGDAVVAPGVPASGIDIGRSDIRHIRRVESLTDDLRPASGSRRLLLWAMPAIIAVAGVVVKVHRKRRAACAKVSARKAFKDLRKEIRRARAAAGRDDAIEEAAATLSRGIAKYLAVRAGCPESAVGPDFIGSIGALSHETRERLAALLATLGQVRFAPGGVGTSEMERLVGEAEVILEGVDREWEG